MTSIYEFNLSFPLSEDDNFISSNFKNSAWIFKQSDKNIVFRQ